MDTSGVANPAPESVYQSYAYADNGEGNRLVYRLPVPDGDYTIHLHFAEPSNPFPGSRVFDIDLQGVTAQAGFDLVAEAGGRHLALVKSFSVQAVGGEGIRLELVNSSSLFGNHAVLSGIELTRVNPGGSSGAMVNVEVSVNNGASYTTVAAAQQPDRFGAGRFTWTAEPETSGSTGLVRVTAMTGIM
ncbi:MAG: hypothetical protein GWO24_08870, partial [Akkermansiaceae bacterium]|nr:hypothetical protein [Akkermansiaceae bacterium]